METCSSRFIRRSYLSRHLCWTHGYTATEARETAISAPRGDKPAQYGDWEDISDDDSILDLLAERDQTVSHQDYCDVIDGFNTNVFNASVTVSDVSDSDDGLDGDVDVEVMEGVTDGDDDVNNSEQNNSETESVQVSDTDGDGGSETDNVQVNDADGDGGSVSTDDVMSDSDNESVIIINSGDEAADTTMIPSNSRTVVQGIRLTLTRWMQYNGFRLVNSTTTVVQETCSYSE